MALNRIDTDPFQGSRKVDVSQIRNGFSNANAAIQSLNVHQPIKQHTAQDGREWSYVVYDNCYTNSTDTSSYPTSKFFMEAWYKEQMWCDWDWCDHRSGSTFMLQYGPADGVYAKDIEYPYLESGYEFTMVPYQQISCAPSPDHSVPENYGVFWPAIGDSYDTGRQTAKKSGKIWVYGYNPFNVAEPIASEYVQLYIYVAGPCRIRNG